jgi:TPR repeat protein
MLCTIQADVFFLASSSLLVSCLATGIADADTAEKAVAARKTKLLADNGDAEAQFTYVVCLFTGFEVDVDESLAVVYFKRSGDQRNARAVQVRVVSGTR